MRILGYKIRDLATGLYLGSGGSWSRCGKVWAQRGHMTAAIRCGSWKRVVLETRPEDFEVVVLLEGETIPFLEFYDEDFKPR